MDGINFKADTSLSKNFEALCKELRQAGWHHLPVRIDQGHGYLVNKFGAFTRDIENPLLIGRNNGKIFSNEVTAEKNPMATPDEECSNNAGFSDVKLLGGESPYGRPQACFAPQSDKALIKTLGDIPSVALMREGLNDSLVIAIDTEYYYDDDGRKILTWQFAFVSFDKTVIHEVVFYSLDGQRLTLGLSLSWLIFTYSLHSLPFSELDSKGFYYRNTRRWVVPVKNADGKTVMKSCRSFEEAVEVCNDEEYLKRLKDAGCRHKKKEENDVGYENDFREFNPKALPVTLLFHTGIADLTGFGFEDFDKDVLSRVSSVGGGLVSLQSFYLHPITPYRYWMFYPIAISVRDTMCFAPAKQKSLESLGKAIGVPKLTIMDGYSKDDMLRYMLEQPVAFMEYAINDSVVTILYASSMWGYLSEMPVTLSSAAVRAAVPVIKRYFGLAENDKKGFNFMFKGLKIVKKGIIPRHDRPGYLEDTALVPVSDDAKLIQSYAKDAFKGGYNGCIDVGWYDGLTYDYDLKNAYPTSMALTMDIDWSSDKVIAREWRNEKMLLEDFKSPYDPIFGYFRFKFPENVKYPCIAVSAEGSLLYPRSFEKGDAEMDGVYAAGPEIYLALCLGAEVTAVRAVKGKYRVNSDFTVSRSLRAVVKNLIIDRNLAKEVFGEGSLAETLLKTAVNSLYGKTAQDIIEKDTWDAFRQMMVNIGCSPLTSPTHASIITAGVRAVLLAAMNELDSLGYKVYSVTTDGFISNAPPEVVKRLSLFGFRVLFEEAREALVGDPTIWQLKHAQTSLLNFSTRGNVALNTEENSVVVNGKSYAGVCAHNSFVTGYELDSYEDRLSLTKTVLSRTKKCTCVNKSFTRFKEVSKPRSQRKDFLVSLDSRNKTMDFDMKRKPLKDTMETVNPIIDEETYEIVNFETVAFENVDEYLAFRKVAQSCSKNGCLRTMADWEKFFLKLDNADAKVNNEHRSSHGLRISDMEWSKIMTLILGYRLGYWDIPYLSEYHKLEDKLKYINSLNKSKKKFSKNNWKDCRKENRVGQMLDPKYIKDLLEACEAIVFERKVS